MVVDLALKIQQTNPYLEQEREIDIFYPAVQVVSGQLACLEMDFTAFTHFEVKLAYASGADNAYRERPLLRSVHSLGKESRLWKTTIASDMTEGCAFVVVLHSRSSTVGIMAVINSIRLLMTACGAPGKYFCFFYIKLALGLGR